MKQNNGRRRFVALRFVLILLIAAAVGFFGGYGASWLRENVLPGLAGQAGDLGGLAAGALPWVFWGFDLAVTLASLGLYCSARGIVRRWDGEDEEFIDRAERRLCAALILANLLMICGFLLFTLLCAGVGEGFWLGLGAFLFCLLASIVLTNLIVRLTKRLNPEKRGEVLDTRFQKDWLNSCDEGEKSVIYRSAFRAYRVGSYTCLGLWLACLIAQVPFGLIGPAPGVCVALVWLALTMSYCLESYRLEHPAKM